MSKRVKVLLVSMERQGCRVIRTTAGWQIFHPNGSDIITIHGTPSDHRAEANVRSQVRRVGLTWPL